jgi:hypothetical protein
MADIDLCASADCAVAELCRRNPSCPISYREPGRAQSWALWHPESGGACHGYIPAAGDPRWPPHHAAIAAGDDKP